MFSSNLRHVYGRVSPFRFGRGSMGAMPAMHLHVSMHLRAMRGASSRSLIWALLCLYVERNMSSL
jgi:hypothetical protein